MAGRRTHAGDGVYQSEVQALIAFIGVAGQTAGTLLIALLFQFIARGRGRHEYVRYWGFAWLAYALALLVLLPYIASQTPALWATAGPPPWWATPVYALYNFCKLCFLMFLLTGLLDYAGRMTARRFLRGAVPTCVAFTALSLALSDDFLASAAWQSVLVVATMAAGYLVLQRLPPSARSYGTGFVSGVLLLNGAIWIVYFGSLVYGTTVPLADQNPLIAGLVLNSGYLDILVEMALAYGLTMILLEENRRDMLGAQRELADTNQQLQRDALFDPLTGVYNRLAFERRTGLGSAGRGFGVVVVVDLDQLKETNDTFGHDVGDRLIKALADALAGRLREMDRIYRIGGDEFVLVMPRATRDEVAARVARVIADAPPFEATSGVRRPLLASIGTAEFRGLDDLGLAFAEADRRMYEHKRSRAAHDRRPTGGADPVTPAPESD